MLSNTDFLLSLSLTHTQMLTKVKDRGLTATSCSVLVFLFAGGSPAELRLCLLLKVSAGFLLPFHKVTCFFKLFSSGLLGQTCCSGDQRT